MLDVNYIRENIELVKKKVSLKNYDPDLVDKLLDIDEKRRTLLTEVDGLRQQRNIAAKDRDMKQGKEVKTSHIRLSFS